ncbi:hypothetical protein KCP74_05130 [Salmonella enterica subsp. enterica]|nr:hypothetical protein KCP74_05130 [Salmonella enterica subsp. enterica]
MKSFWRRFGTCRIPHYARSVSKRRGFKIAFAPVEIARATAGWMMMV